MTLLRIWDTEPRCLQRISAAWPDSVKDSRLGTGSDTPSQHKEDGYQQPPALSVIFRAIKPRNRMKPAAAPTEAGCSPHCATQLGKTHSQRLLGGHWDWTRNKSRC